MQYFARLFPKNIVKIFTKIKKNVVKFNFFYRGFFAKITLIN